MEKDLCDKLFNLAVTEKLVSVTKDAAATIGAAHIYYQHDDACISKTIDGFVEALASDLKRELPSIVIEMRAELETKLSLNRAKKGESL